MVEFLFGRLISLSQKKCTAAALPRPWNGWPTAGKKFCGRQSGGAKKCYLRMVATRYPELELQPDPELDVPWRRDVPIPHPEIRISEVCDKGGVLVRSARPTGVEDVPIEQIEELSPELESNTFADSDIFEDGEVRVLVAKTSHIGNARPHPVVEVKAFDGFEGIPVEERLVDVKAILVLSERIGSRLDHGNASLVADSELFGNITLGRAEEKRQTRERPVGAAYLPATQDLVGYSTAARESFPS